MISIYPTIYHAFQCKAHHCHHTCCQKWTIDIDDKTAELYHNLQSPLGESLRQAITIDDEGAHFVFSDAQPRCALLREDGLCKVVLELGEEGLCETCHMHPRFYKYIEDLELCGVGLSCEASVEALIDTGADELLFTVEDDDGEFSADERLTLSNVFDVLGLSIDAAYFQYAPYIDKEHLLNIVDLYQKTEPIDENWSTMLIEVQSRLTDDAETIDTLTDGIPCPSTFIQSMQSLSISMKQLVNKCFQYILYRQIDMLADYSIDTLFTYAQESTDFIMLLAVYSNNINESIRRWSEQMEYNEDNIIYLFDAYENGSY